MAAKQSSTIRSRLGSVSSTGSRVKSARSSISTGNSRGYYDVMVKACAKYPCKVGIRSYNEGKLSCYSYSELFGVCEYIAQNLQQFKCNKGVIGLVSRTNFIVPCAIAAAHKCCTSFMFLDPTGDVSDIANDIQFTVIISILLDPLQTLSNDLNKAPDRTIKVFDYTISFYNYGPPISEIYQNMVEHSFIARTSGSTGQPKNIQVPIKCIQPNIDDLTGLFNITTDDVIFFSTPLTFDPSMVEILLACTNGASLLIAPDKAELLFPKQKELKENSVTVWQTTPSKFLQYSNAAIRNSILSANSTLKVLALGGEPMSSLKRLKHLKDPKNKTKIFTLYGVTEMSCWACAAEIYLDKYTADRELPLGKCLSETQVIVEPQSAEPSTGKIILVSKTRQCIVLNRTNGGEERNSLKFVDTGDLAEVKNGTMYYRGRTDDQIKRFGHKVNLLFIESVINQCPKVQACSCIWLPKPKLLIVYFASDTINSRQLSDFLKCKLDDKHWPDKIIRLDSIPTNPHGKVSKSALSKMYKEKSYGPNLDSLKVILLQELKNFLHTSFTYDDIKHKNFYALGGTSFKAVAICNKISSVDGNFGKFLLPHLMSHKATIDQIMLLAEQMLCADDVVTELPRADVVKAKKRSKRSASDTTSNSSAPVKKAVQPKLEMEFVLLWTSDTGKCIDATPSVWKGDSTLFVTVGSHSGKIIVVDGLYGELYSTIPVRSRIEASILCFNMPPSSTPYGIVGAYDGTVICFTLDTCEVVWKEKIGAMVKSKAAVVNDLLYIAAYDGYIRCMDLKTGKIHQLIQITDQAISADLVLAKKQYILTGSLSGVCASLHTDTNTVAWRATLSSPIFASPTLYDQDKYVVFAEVCGEIHCRTVEKGIKIWRFSGARGNIFSSIYVTEVEHQKWQMMFGCHDKNLYNITVKNFQPSLNWKCPLSAPIYATPTGFNDKIVLAASNDGKLNVIDSTNGMYLTVYEMPAETFSSPTVYQDYIFIGCRNDHLFGLRLVLNETVCL